MEIRNIIRRILNEEFLNEEMSEYARTLKNARKQGSGLRFPKSAIKANPNRFRPYSREQVDESLHKTKHFYGFLGLPNYWVDDNDKNYPDKFFNDKEYEDKIFDNFFDMDKEFGHKNSLFGTRGLEPGNPNRTSKSFNQYVERFGPMIVRILKKENIQESIKKITCKCGWSWKLKDGGNDPYTCHKCGHINSKKNIKEDAKKDLSPVLKNLLNKLLVKHHKDILCGVEVEQSIDGESYEVIFTFIVHRNKLSFDTKEKHESIMNEAWDLVYDFTNQTIVMKSKYVRTCNE